MITMSKWGNHGRTGNQLFQWAFLSTLAREHNVEVILPESTFFDCFENKPKTGTIKTDIEVKEPHYEYNPAPYENLDYSNNIDFLGYWQNEKYWDDKVLEEIKFKQSFKDAVKEKFSQLFDKPTIAIGIRRTDYLNEPAVYHQLPIEYFITALLKIENWRNHNIIFISDDLDYCKIHFECLPNAFFPKVKDLEQMCLMSMADNFIIANSTFYWWAAKLGHPKRVIQPTKLFAGKLLQRYGDINFFSDDWEFHEATTIPLKDCTFTIPVLYDHNDRKQNLDLSVCMIQKSFDTNIIVGEQGGRRFEYMSKYCKYHSFDDVKEFHRTKMLNDMAMMAETEIIANWDCDVIIPPMQIYLTCEAIRNGAEMVFPYDGRFARFERLHWFKKIERHLDIGIIGNAPLKGKNDTPVPVTSVGGAVFFNKESFIDGGLENENMISFGPEDVERSDRFKLLEYNVQRVGGCLYHISHWCGPNSSTKNPHFRANHVEIQKIRQMTKNQLREYVDSWPWRHKYTEKYYRRISEGAVRSAGEVYEELTCIGVAFDSVIDVGCGVGEWNDDNPSYIGLDFNTPKRSLLIPDERYIEFDLTSGDIPIDRTFDLCLCLEVAEHLPESSAELLIRNLCRLSDKILFSAAIPMQGGVGHENEQWQSYWAALFAKFGYYPALCQPKIRDNAEIEIWYRQNIILYEKDGQGYVEDFILPEYYLQICKHLKKDLV